MKNTFKYIAFVIALLASSVALNAQYHREGGMATSKKVTGPTGGYYTLELESFATGETTVTETVTPVDIVLVLDVSGSMDENMTSYSYTARPSQAYSYSSYGNSTYYYLHTDGNYYAVNRNDGRRLRFQVGNTWWYLTGTTATTTRPNQAANNNSTIWTGVLYTRSSSSQNKLVALKNAVQAFVNTVNENANYDSKGNQRETPLTNQIAVVKYAMNRYYDDDASSIAPGNHVYDYTYGSGYQQQTLTNANYSEVVVGFTDVSTTDGVNAVMGEGSAVGVNDLTARGATASDYGMTKAEYLLNQDAIKNRESNKVVVLFTDGSPTYADGFQTDVAGNTIAIAYRLKNTNKASVFTIGVFSEETTNIKNYMNWTSSNYPNQQGWTNNGSTTTPTTDSFYQNASGADLTEIFKAVASASAAADATAGASTQVRDVISNSFIMPEGDAAQITIKVADITSDGLGWETPVVAEGVSYEVTTVTTSSGEEHKQLMVTGFDYTKSDTYDSDGFTIVPGNWVGERYSDANTMYWAGKKLIISFKIKADDEATGGDGSATNHPDSGIYVQQFNDDGTPKLDANGNPIYSSVNHYEVPHTDLPLLIKITKDGLRTGESATFQIMRIRPKVDDDGNYVINAIGKPQPNTHDFDSQNGKLDPNDPMDYLEGTGWEDWSKVILTNKGADKAKVEKDLYGLDPGWVYIVIEDDWGWTYNLTGSASSMTTANTEINPFNFHNELRTVNLEGNPIVKHAEAVTINHFETLEGEGAREEHYKSSKVILNTQ